MAYGLGELSRDMRRAFSMAPAETVRRISLRASRYVRRVRNRRKRRALSDAELLGALSEPVDSVADLLGRRKSKTHTDSRRSDWRPFQVGVPVSVGRKHREFLRLCQDLDAVRKVGGPW